MKNNELLELKKLLDEFGVMLFNPSPTNDALVSRLSDINDSISYMLTPRTKPEFVKCDYGEKVSNIVMDFENNAPLYKVVNDEYWTIDELDDLFAIILDGGEHVYRKVENEIDERQEFIEALVEMNKKAKSSGLYGFFGELYDSGKFKLVG
ncbi:hypothetical protein VPHK121_0088 [Vibrio phage K121]